MCYTPVEVMQDSTISILFYIINCNVQPDGQIEQQCNNCSVYSWSQSLVCDKQLCISVSSFLYLCLVV